MTTQKLPTRTAESILQEIDNGSFKNWTIAERALNVDSLKVSKSICSKQCSDGDLQSCVRRELSKYHQKINLALLIIENHPASIPYQFVEVKYPKQENVLFEVLVDKPNYEFLWFAGASILTILYFVIR